VMVSMMSWTFSSSRDEKVYIEIQCGRMSSIAQFAGFTLHNLRFRKLDRKR
jgi:hypothetical protein